MRRQTEMAESIAQVTQAEPRHNLPVQPRSFVGREKERAEVKQLFEGERMITLTGPGGIGKTRLALQVASELLQSFSDSVWLVELAPLSEPKLIPVVVAAAVGVRAKPGRPLMETLIDWLASRQALLILDSCEHLVEATGRFVDAVLRGSPEVKILATSREELGTSAETVYPVPPLRLPRPDRSASATAPGNLFSELTLSDAVLLFGERALEARPGFALSPRKAMVVVQLCRRLGGIPLAIELAAAGCSSLSVERVAAQVTERIRELTGKSGKALHPQQTVRCAIDWSYGLLSEQEQLSMRRLSVFAGGWTREAAEHICSGEGIEPEEVLDIMTCLIDKFLVVLKPPLEVGRYYLPETIRQYAIEKLREADESDRLHDRHMQVFLEQAEQARRMLTTSEGAEWLTRMESEVGNLRAAFEWALERDPERARRLAGFLPWF